MDRCTRCGGPSQGVICPACEATPLMPALDLTAEQLLWDHLKKVKVIHEPVE